MSAFMPDLAELLPDNDHIYHVVDQLKHARKKQRCSEHHQLSGHITCCEVCDISVSTQIRILRILLYPCFIRIQSNIKFSGFLITDLFFIFHKFSLTLYCYLLFYIIIITIRFPDMKFYRTILHQIIFLSCG